MAMLHKYIAFRNSTGRNRNLEPLFPTCWRNWSNTSLDHILLCAQALHRYRLVTQSFLRNLAPTVDARYVRESSSFAKWLHVWLPKYACRVEQKMNSEVLWIVAAQNVAQTEELCALYRTRTQQAAAIATRREIVTQMPVALFLQLFPSAVAKKVLQGMLARIAPSRTLLEDTQGWRLCTTAAASAALDASTAISAQLICMDCNSVSEYVKKRMSDSATVAQPLTATHKAGPVPIQQQAANKGQDPGPFLERTVAELSAFFDDLCSQKRSNDMLYRGKKATWGNIASAVTQKLGVKCSASTIRRKAPPGNPRSHVAKIHHPVAQIGCRRVKQESGAWHVDAHATNKLVKMAILRGLHAQANALVAVVDDHSKFDTVKARSFMRNRTVLLLSEKRTGPYSDSDTMKKVPSVKCVTNSMSVGTLPPRPIRRSVKVRTTKMPRTVMMMITAAWCATRVTSPWETSCSLAPCAEGLATKNVCKAEGDHPQPLIS